jgi:Mce-associated membrane protein
MTRPTPRRPSRTTTPRPRKIAGQSVPPAGDDARPVEEQHDEPGWTPMEDADADAPVAKDDPEPGRAGALASPRVTRVLTVVVAVLVLLLLLQGVWFVVHQSRNDGSTAVADERAPGEPIQVPADRPVVLSQLAVQEGVDAAAHAAETMFARDYEGYDEGVEQATTLMTDDFAEEYRETTDDVKDEFIAKKTAVEVRVVAQSVVRANAAELEALIFLNQYVFRGKGEDATTAVTPYRALLTMVHTDRGWFVDGVETK